MSGASVPLRVFAACSMNNSSMHGIPVAIQRGRAHAGCTHSQHVHRIQEASGYCVGLLCTTALSAPAPGLAASLTTCLSNQGPARRLLSRWLGRAAPTARLYPGLLPPSSLGRGRGTPRPEGPWGCTSSTFFHSGINTHAVLKEGKIRLRSCGYLNKHLTSSVSSCKSVK